MSMKSMLRICATTCLLSTPMMGAVAHAAPPTASQSDSVRASLVVDTSRAGAAGPVIQRRIEERANIVLRREAVLSGDESSMRVQVQVRELGGDDPGYELEIGIFRPDDSEAEVSRVVGCALCTESELVAAAERELTALVPRLRALSGAQASEGDGDADPSEATGPDVGSSSRPSGDAAPQMEARARLPLIMGGSFAALGLAGVGAGIGLVLREPRPDPDDPRFQFSTRNPGYAMLAIGGAVLVTGVALLAIGGERHRRATVWAPWLTPDGGGLALHTNF